MFDFLKKKDASKEEDKQNEFLSIENSAFNTQAEVKTFQDKVDYQSLTYQEPIYDVPKYKAENLKNLGVVVDSDQIGFDKSAIYPNVKMIELPNNDDETGQELVEPVMPLEDVPVEIIETLEILDPFESTFSTSVNAPILEKEIKEETLPVKKDSAVEEEKFSLFGSKDGHKNKIEYSSLQQFEEEKKELQQEVEYTKEGYKICPKCGAILKPDAPVCFMCSKSFILKK